MCARIRIREAVIKPCQRVPVWTARRVYELPLWGGFTRRESLGWWEKNGGVLIDVPANQFAESSHEGGQLVWKDIPMGQVIRGVLDARDGELLLKIVIRVPTAAELAEFEHPRMPLLAPPLFSAELTPFQPEPDGRRQIGQQGKFPRSPA